MRYSLVVVGVAICVSSCSGKEEEARQDASMSDIGSPAVDQQVIDDVAPAKTRVCVDEAHHNYHTASGKYKPFAEALAGQGYVVAPFTHAFEAADLTSCDVLVIANALNQVNVVSWSLPTPSAFTDDEIAALGKWVEAGGALFLIADHMPFPGAAERLATLFGVTFHNGFALHKTTGHPDIFSRDSTTLAANVITDGRNAAERVETVQTFTGQAFDLPKSAAPIITLSSDYHLLLPETAWEFLPTTPSLEAEGMAQLAYLDHGAGRVVISGEAAMFTVQKGVGLSSEDNRQLLFNIMRWLGGQL